MKKSIKIFGLILLSLVLIIILLIIVASLSQNKIVDVTVKKISRAVNAPIEIENAFFTLIKSFPNATVELSGVRIGVENSDKSPSQSLANQDILKIKRIFISLKTLPFFRGEYEIKNIEIDGASVNYNVDSTGRSNIDFLLKLNENEADSVSNESASGGLLLVDLKKVKLTNTLVYYNDDSLKMAANMFFQELYFWGKLTNENFEGSAEGDVKLTDCHFDGTNLNRMEEASVSFNLDYEADTLKITKLVAETDGAKIKLQGKLAFSNILYTDLALEIKSLEMGKFEKYIPDELFREYGIEELTGNMDLSGTVEGQASDTIMPFFDFAIDLKNGFVKTRDYPTVQNINFEGEISNGSQRNNATTNAIFKSFHAETDSSEADMTLLLINFEKPIYDIQSKLKIKIREFKNFIPDSIFQNISGEIVADISTKGQIPKTLDENFINLIANNTSANVDFSDVQFKMDSLQINGLNASISYSPNHLKVHNLKTEIPEWQVQLKNTSIDAHFTGKVTEPNELEIALNSFKTEMPQGIFWGSAEIKNLESPDFVLSANANVDLAKIKPFLPDSLIKSISGNLDTEIGIHGKVHLDSIENQLTDLIFKQSSINITAKNISLVMPNTLQQISGLNGEVEMENGKISIAKLNGVAAGIDFHIDSTTILNVYEALIKNQEETVRAQGIFEFGPIDYATLAAFIPDVNTVNSTNSTVGQNSKTVKIPTEEKANEATKRNFLFEFKGKIAAKSFKYDKIFLEDISAKFNLSDSVYIVDQFKTRAFDGSTNSSVRYSLTKNNRQIINVKNHVENMDINKLLFAFDNFGYDSLISYENLSGIFSADLNSRFVFDADTLASNDMRILGSFKLKNGKLVNYKPAMEVSSFTGIKELDNIDMKTLECNIFMFKNKIYVPITKIVSSSMDLSTFGMQSMGDDYEYHIQMKLSEILKGKSQKLFERQQSSGDEVSEDDLDKNTIKLIYGYVDGKKKVGFATKKAQKQMALKIQVQQKMLELIFHPKLESFDTGVN